MISRLTVLATTFAILASASLTYATSAHRAATPSPVAVAKQVRIVELERVVITAKRLNAATR